MATLGSTSIRTDGLIREWLGQARLKVAEGRFGPVELDQLAALLEGRGSPLRCQRLLYLHASEPSIYSRTLAMAQHEPVRGHRIDVRIDQQWPYNCVHDALIEGWRVVQFPDQRAPFDDGEIDVLGYEFILEKWEPVHDGDAK